MVKTLPNKKYGAITLQQAIEWNDYDPYTTLFARARGADVTSIQNEITTKITIVVNIFEQIKVIVRYNIQFRFLSRSFVRTQFTTNLNSSCIRKTKTVPDAILLGTFEC
jgi:hypothetical protein